MATFQHPEMPTCPLAGHGSSCLDSIAQHARRTGVPCLTSAPAGMPHWPLPFLMGCFWEVPNEAWFPAEAHTVVRVPGVLFTTQAVDN